MRSILTVIGTFIFGLFCEFFIRIVIIFYHQSDWEFSGYSGLPNISWLVILGIGIFIATWISGMLAVTITNFSPFKHLLALCSLFILLRISEFYGMQEPSIWYTVGFIILQAIALSMAYIIKIKSNVQTSDI